MNLNPVPEITGHQAGDTLDIMPVYLRAHIQNRHFWDMIYLNACLWTMEGNQLRREKICKLQTHTDGRRNRTHVPAGAESQCSQIYSLLEVDMLSTVLFPRALSAVAVFAQHPWLRVITCTGNLWNAFSSLDAGTAGWSQSMFHQWFLMNV